MKQKLLIISACTIAALIINCRSGESTVRSEDIIPDSTLSEQAAVPEPRKPETDSYVSYIKANLHKLQAGMSRSSVEGILQLSSRFHGIVTSDGSMDSFTYYYELKGYQLILNFDYRRSRDGEFKRYELNSLM